MMNQQQIEISERPEGTERNDFAMLFVDSQNAILDDREFIITEMRFGFMGGDTHTLRQIAHHVGVSRERIRQILEKVFKKFVGEGRKALKKGNATNPCAALLLYVERMIRPDEDNAINRIVDFVAAELSYLPLKTHALPLISYLSFKNYSSLKSYIEQAVEAVNARKAHNKLQYKKELLSDKFNNLLSSVIWPSCIRPISSDEISSIERQRNVSEDSEGNTGEFFSSKMKRSVQYESDLEYDFLQKLEAIDSVVFFQEQPFKIYYEYGGNNIPYHPDVFFSLENKSGIVVEIKPVFKMVLHQNLKKYAAMEAFCSKNGFGLLITDGKYTIQHIERHEVNYLYENEVLSAIQKSALSWSDYKELCESHNLCRLDFPALVLKHQLVWTLNPFMLGLRL